MDPDQEFLRIRELMFDEAATLPREGQPVTNEDLAATLRQIAGGLMRLQVVIDQIDQRVAAIEQELRTAR